MPLSTLYTNHDSYTGEAKKSHLDADLRTDTQRVRHQDMAWRLLVIQIIPHSLPASAKFLLLSDGTDASHSLRVPRLGPIQLFDSSDCNLTRPAVNPVCPGLSVLDVCPLPDQCYPTKHDA